MRRPDSLRTLSDSLSLRWLRRRSTLPLLGGRLPGDEFMKLAGRFDLGESRRRPVPGTTPRRVRER